MPRIISIYNNFSNKGGAQNITIQIAQLLNNEKPIILTHTPIDNIENSYINKANFQKFSICNVAKLANKSTVFISHNRLNTTLLFFFNIILFGKLRIIHVAHSTFNNLKLFTFFPKNIIAVSNGVKNNLINYFKIPSSRISVIFNGIKDQNKNVAPRNKSTNTNTKTKQNINIILIGRICSVKRQLDIVKNTKGKISPHIHIFFAGEGIDSVLLKQEIESSPQYHFLGLIETKEVIPNFDYILLFSEKEGLPLTLIEGCMFGKPLITNNLDSILDINTDNQTGFICKNYEELISCINSLPHPNSIKYKEMSCAARKKYEDYFTEEQMVNSYKSIIRKAFNL